MSESELLFGFLVGMMIVAAAVILLSALQISRINQEAELRSAVKLLRGKKQPSVTVLVYTYGAHALIERTLRSLKNNRYRAFDVVVVDDASNDGTYEVTQEFIKKYPKFNAKILRRRARKGSRLALQAGYRKSQKGSIVIVVTPDMTLDQNFIKRAVASKRQRATWRASITESMTNAVSLLEIGQFLEKYYWQRASYASACDARYFIRTKPEHVPIARQIEPRRGAAVALFLVLVVTAFLFLGMKLFWYAWILVTAYGLVVTWLRYGEPLRDRLILTLSIPLALFLIPVTGAVRGFSQFSNKK